MNTYLYKISYYRNKNDLKIPTDKPQNITETFITYPLAVTMHGLTPEIVEYNLVQSTRLQDAQIKANEYFNKEKPADLFFVLENRNTI